MNRFSPLICRLSLALVVAAVVWGCGDRQPPPRILPGDFLKLTFEAAEGGKGAEITVELVFDDPSRRRGLMRRAEMPWDQGMLFIHPDKRERSFWMKNTPLPLSIAFLDDDGQILQIEHMEPNDERHTLSKDKVKYALEMNQEWFRKAGLGVGNRVQDFRAKVSRIPVR